MNLQEQCKNLEVIVNATERIINEIETYLLTKPANKNPNEFLEQALLNLIADYGQDIGHWIDDNIFKDINLEQYISTGIDISKFNTMLIEDVGVLITALTQFVASISKNTSEWNKTWNDIINVFSSIKSEKRLPGIDVAVEGYKKIADTAAALETQLLLGNTKDNATFKTAVTDYNKVEDSLLQSFNTLSTLAHSLKTTENPPKLTILLSKIESLLQDLVGNHIDTQALIENWTTEIGLNKLSSSERLYSLSKMIYYAITKHPLYCLVKPYADIYTKKEEDGAWIYTSPITNVDQAIPAHFIPWWYSSPSTANWFLTAADLNTAYKLDPYYDWPNLLEINDVNNLDARRLAVAFKAIGTKAVMQSIHTPKEAIYYFLHIPTANTTIEEASLSSIINTFLAPQVLPYKTHTLTRDASLLALHLQELQALEVSGEDSTFYFKQEDIPRLLYSSQNPYKLLDDAQKVSELYFDIKNSLSATTSDKKSKAFKYITINSQANSIDLLIQLLDKYSNINSPLYTQLPEYIDGVPVRQTVYDSIYSWISPINWLLTKTGNYIAAFIYIPVYYLMEIYLLIWLADQIEHTQFAMPEDGTLDNKTFKLLIIQSTETIIDKMISNLQTVQPVTLVTAIVSSFSTILEHLPIAGQVANLTNILDNISQTLFNLENGYCGKIWDKVEPLLFDTYWATLKQNKSNSTTKKQEKGTAI